MTQPTDIRRVPGSPPTIVALCAGYGGLEAAIRARIGGQVAAYAENDPHAATVFAHRHPEVPNLGDIRNVDWDQVRDVYRPDVIGAGFPCRNTSNAGRRDGINGQWSRVWKNVAQAVGHLRPRLVFLENVAALRSRGLDVVAADLATLGYDVRWTCVRAGDPEVGAPHERDRWFAVAHPADADPHQLGRHWRPRHQPETQGRVEPAHRSDPPAGTPSRRLRLLPTPKASDGPHGGPNQRDTSGRYYLPGQAVRLDERWVSTDGTDYGPAIHRWEHITGRAAPCPTEPGRLGKPRLSPAFVEWMMGLPGGWVTAVPGIPRKEQLKILGNGVVPRQAHHAYGWLLGTATARPSLGVAA
ncbi:DNA (cytosine-5)-methyltransferase 1 [Streptomyces sp. Ag82_O1-12]|uniref:DNA cytosine methyltransferase n=1 Tax=unclassified Streptomyces TaxID=2593676 RepID=UPI000BCBAF1F|nr:MULTISPECIES: DNA cytosine methyltransferase [unclassified Streptomyces]SMQ17475.1 DNA (cytosine-5)-methyltransferase 1 [Streptomyces sp. Ag82_O1-12]SOD46510.1 DNA (cytosine-5)-methyltransferase 1 [Streptomyces sp. Ag82_G6-1]